MGLLLLDQVDTTCRVFRPSDYGMSHGSCLFGNSYNIGPISLRLSQQPTPDRSLTTG